MFVRNSAEDRPFRGTIYKVRTFITPPAATGKKLFVPVWIPDVYLIRVDANNGSYVEIEVRL